MREKDVLLYYPYHPFDYFLDLLREGLRGDAGGRPQPHPRRRHRRESQPGRRRVPRGGQPSASGERARALRWYAETLHRQQRGTRAVDAMEEALPALGVPRERVITERFDMA